MSRWKSTKYRVGDKVRAGGRGPWTVVHVGAQRAADSHTYPLYVLRMIGTNRKNRYETFINARATDMRKVPAA